MAAILLSYLDHCAPEGGGAVHGSALVDQFRRLGHRVLTAEPRTDTRTESFARTWTGMGALLDQADVIYMRCDIRPFDEALLMRNRQRRRRLPVVLEVNAPPEEVLARGTHLGAQARLRYRQAHYRFLLHHADTVVCVSTALRDHMLRGFGLATTRVVVVPNGGTPAAEIATGRPTGAGFRAVWAGGSKWPWQALDTVVAAARLLVQAEPAAGITLFTDGPLDRFAGCAGIEARPPVPHHQMAQVLGTMDAALCLYRQVPTIAADFYNSPLKLFDAMAAGLPVVGSPMGQIAEVIRHGTEGFLVADDPAEVCARLVDLARDPPLRRRMGQAALDRLRDGYTWDHTGKRIDGILRELLGGVK